MDGTHVDHTKSAVSYHDFVHKELVQFAKYDVERSIPSVVDGFKPSQRKVLFCCFKKKLKSDIKVAQLVGYTSEQSAYHHGEVSLENTIINLAQNFVGSNNVNLLFPSGQFGTRLQGGKDHAASRYIFTRLCAITRTIFHQEDDPILKYLDDEGQSIEPYWYCPILPLVLVNGADGIGTGWSTFIPNYNPRDIVRNIRKMLRGEKMADMLPWYKGFQGTIMPNEKESEQYDVIGSIQKTSDTTLTITELPIRKWTQNYKEFLEELMPQEGKKAEECDSTITDYKEYHTENTVHFELTLTPAKMKEVEKAGLEKTFKLKNTISTSNMTLFDSEGKISKYNSALDILTEFCKLRRTVYVQRKAHMVAKLTREKEILSNKARFILMVVKGEIELRKRKKVDLLNELKKKGFKPMSELDAILSESPAFKGKGSGAVSKTAEADASKENDKNKDGGDKEDAAAEKTDYDYLLGMALWSLTFEKVEELKKQHEVKSEELKALQATTIETMWDRDLEAFLKALEEMEALEAEDDAFAEDAVKNRRKKAGSKLPPAGAKRKAAPKARSGGKRLADDDEDFSRPLQEGSSENLGEDVAKTTWGSGAPTTRKNPDAPAYVAPPAAKAPRRTAGSRSAAAEAAPEPAPAPEEIGGAGLLSRLLSKPTSTPSTTDTSYSASFSSLGSKKSSLDNSYTSSFSALGGADDVFAYLRGAPSSGADQDDDPFGLPPALADASSATETKAEEEKKDEGAGKAKGRQAKKQKTQS